MQRVTVPIRQSLSYRQTRNTVLVAFTIGLILSSAQIYLDYFSQQNQLRESVQNVVATANRAAFHAAFNLDETGAVQITRGLVSNQSIIKATITDNASSVLGTATGDTSTEVSTASRWLFGNPRTISLPLFDETEFDQPVGELTVIVDPSLNAETFIQRSKVVLVSGILRNFILALCIITVFYFTITRSLLQASLPIQQGMTNKRIPMPANHSGDEIGVLISAFNEHLAIIEAQHEQILDSNINLESQVIERTHELDEKNHQLDKQRQAALMGSKAKSDFLAMMSHEIRTPMNGILGMAELLERDSKAPKRKEYVDAILDSSKSLLSLMNSVLDYSKYEREHFAVEKIPFDLNRLVNGIVFLLSASAEKKHTLLSASFANDLPLYIVGDQEKLRQVLLNLLTNAIKFTSDGAVSLTVITVPLFRPSSEQDIRLRFEVNDTGIGIPEKDKEGIFDAFTQANSSISRRFGGSGMGLAICRQIVEKQGGSIGFKSEALKGSNFWFELDFPIAGSLAEGSKMPEQAPAPAKPLDVLVVDDVPINLKLVEGQLGVDDHRVLVAGDGQEALALLSQNHVDLVLMDLHMPVMDGLEASRQIRQLTQENKRDVPIVGMTANLSSEGKEACIASGMNFVVTKPVDYKTLCGAIKRAMSLSVATGTTPGKGENRPLDIEVLAAHREALGADKVGELYREAIESLNKRVSALTESDSDDIAALEDQAHALAGLCSNFGFPVLGALACNIESAAQRGEITMLGGLVAQLDGLAKTTIQAFDQQ